MLAPEVALRPWKRRKPQRREKRLPGGKIGEKVTKLGQKLSETQSRQRGITPKRAIREKVPTSTHIRVEEGLWCASALSGATSSMEKPQLRDQPERLRGKSPTLYRAKPIEYRGEPASTRENP